MMEDASSFVLAGLPGHPPILWMPLRAALSAAIGHTNFYKEFVEHRLRLGFHLLKVQRAHPFAADWFNIHAEFVDLVISEDAPPYHARPLQLALPGGRLRLLALLSVPGRTNGAPLHAAAAAAAAAITAGGGLLWLDFVEVFDLFNRFEGEPFWQSV